MNDSTKLKIYRVLFLALFILGLVFIRKHFQLEELITLTFVQGWFEANLILGSVIFITLFTLGNLMQIPGFLFLILALTLLGKIYGAVLIMVSALVSSAVIFCFIDLIGHNVLAEIRYPWVQRLLGKLKQRPILIVALLRMLFQTAPALNYTLALSGLSFRNYMLGTLIGLPLPILIYIIFFETLLRIVGHPI